MEGQVEEAEAEEGSGRDKEVHDGPAVEKGLEVEEQAEILPRRVSFAAPV
jgi:hypothetical protein